MKLNTLSASVQWVRRIAEIKGTKTYVLMMGVSYPRSYHSSLYLRAMAKIARLTGLAAAMLS